MSADDPKWIFNPKLTSLHIAYSVQVNSSLHRSIILGQLGSVTWITGKIGAKPPVLYRRYTATMCFFLSVDAMDSSLMRLWNDWVPWAIFSLFRQLNSQSVCSVCFQLIASRSNKLVMMYVKSPVTPCQEKYYVVLKLTQGTSGDPLYHSKYFCLPKLLVSSVWVSSCSSKVTGAL